MKIYLKHNVDIMCMSDVRGRRIKVEPDINFSFYYSPRNSSHGPRVKVIFDPDRIKSAEMSNLRVCGDWRFTPNKEADKSSSKDIAQVKAFFRKYLILILIAWEDATNDQASIRDYFEGDITLHEFIKELKFYDEYSKKLDKIQTVAELEQFCRTNDLINMYGN